MRLVRLMAHQRSGFRKLFSYILAACNAFHYWHWVLTAQIGILLLYVLCVPRNLIHIASVDVKSPHGFRLMFKQFPFAFIFGMCLMALENFHATGIMFHISNFALEQSVPLGKIFKFSPDYPFDACVHANGFVVVRIR